MRIVAHHALEEFRLANHARKICAVIAEYNPFHNGHAYQLKKAREKSGADFIAVLMSGCFTQRGEAALFSPFARGEMALRCGADMVFSSPVSVSVREADSYAEYNVRLLNQLHYITHLAFGAECGDLPLLEEIARILETPNDDLDKAYKRHLDTHACSHAQALCRALNETYGVPEDIVSQPNNILAISYLRALRKTKSKIQPVVVQRLKSYHEREVEMDFPSATSLRSAIRRGDWASVKTAVPEEAFKVMQAAALKGEISTEENVDRLLQYRLATITKEEFWSLPDAYEGIENLIFKRNHAALTREELILHSSTRRYSMARMSRLLCHALLHTNQTVWSMLPEHLHLVGFRSEAACVVKRLEKYRIQVVQRRRISQVSEQLQADRRADAVWYTTTNGKGGLSQMRKTMIF